MKKHQVKTVQSVEVKDSKGNIISKEMVTKIQTVDAPESIIKGSSGILMAIGAPAPKKLEHGRVKPLKR